MIDTLLANLDRFDADRAQVGPRPAPGARALRGRDDAPAGERGRPRPGRPHRRPCSGRSPTRSRSCVPLHPRGRPTLEAAGLVANERLRIVEPLGYVDFLSLVRGAALVVTDSGGIQEETTVLGVPCLTVRPNTERPITITHGTNRLLEPEAVEAAVAIGAGRWPRRPGRGPAAVGRPRRRSDRRDHRDVAGRPGLT